MHSHNGFRSTATCGQWARPRATMRPCEFGGTMAFASTSLGEASARIQATDLERRKTPRVRTALPGLRVEPKWLPESPDTPCSAKAPARGVPSGLSRRAMLLSSTSAWAYVRRRWGPAHTSEIDDRLVPIRDRSDSAN